LLASAVDDERRAAEWGSDPYSKTLGVIRAFGSVEAVSPRLKELGEASRLRGWRATPDPL